MRNGIGPKSVAEAIVAKGGAVRAQIEGHDSVVTANVWSSGVVSTTEVGFRDHYITAEFIDDPNSPKFGGVPPADAALQLILGRMEWQPN